FVGGLVISLILCLVICKFDVKGWKVGVIGLGIGGICRGMVELLVIGNAMDANNGLVWLSGSLYGDNICNLYSVLRWFIMTVVVVLLVG
ncbi:iron chelate uptake ABC transporter family permease subunit, partial [Staphylococcus capitis]|uniref:iron chelate uptake ABC transporter family permease subunit n=1 Tax=Staphylococcus capitis TaxID=29388 RepID=UPI00119D79A8